MGNKASKQVTQLHKKVGDSGFKRILVRERSPYQSLAYRDMHNACDDKIDNIEAQGNKVIDQQIEKSKEDYDYILTQLTEKDSKSVKKIEARSKKTLKQVVGYDNQLEKYERIRDEMKHNFQKEKINMQNDFRAQQKGGDSSSYNTDQIPGFDDQPQDKKRQMLKQIQEKYGKKWIQKQQKQAKKNPKPSDSAANYQQKYLQRFRDMVPYNSCQQTNKEIKQHFDKELRQALGTKNVCC